MTIYDQLKTLLQNREGDIVTPAHVKEELQKRYGTNPASLLLSDFCYNRYNKGIEFNKHLFRYISRSFYEYLGEKAPFTGLIFHKPTGEPVDVIVGEWRHGEKYLYDKPNYKDGSEQISNEQIKKLFETYLDI